MKKQIVILLIILAFPLVIAAQTVMPQIIASSGSSYETPSAQLDWTLGELITETYTAGSIILTQGFHQPEISVETGYSDPDIQLSVNVFPVPSSSYITVEFNEIWQGMTIELFNLQGIRISSTPVINQRVEINLLDLPSAGYILKVITNENKMIKSYTIIKN